MIEVFKTNVQNKTQAKRIVRMLQKLFSDARINFDLHDCDKILRIEGVRVSCLQSIINGLNSLGFSCEILN